MIASMRRLVAVPITDLQSIGNDRIRITMLDGRRLTMRAASIEIVPGHAMLPEAFATKIGAITAKTTQAIP